MDKSLKLQLLNYLKEFITEDRWTKINEVLSSRTRYLTVVLEDIYQPHNASAVLRSCDGFGIQDVHIIENKNEFDPNKGVTIGADKWISYHQYSKEGQNNTERCFQSLREQGYQVIATTPHHDDVTIDEVPLDKPTALVFGAELTGLSDYAMEEADGYAKIPMHGFSESFNISVGAALCLYDVTTRLRKGDQNWSLTEEEKLELQLDWVRKSVRAPKKLEERFFEERGK
ncbi:TrmH family RNA methyltransferase [Fodinibius halophilus]|uniref:tRNA (guanosine(18)-2'-O)-methyltransferase n=1 Tax=Fodinibius halophilus TaxID=1736908 RepID=A0A6M1TD37_9BACT|nr:RNA methyltransferase [Fodinibius halophilus]NGP88082.1 RNA methyltransferase [Fodinibius halophilus]